MMIGTDATYLLLHVVQRVRRVDSKADKNDVGVGVGKRTKTVIVFLSGSIPKSKLHVLSINLDICDVVLEDRGNVYLPNVSTVNGQVHQQHHRDEDAS